MNWKPFLLTLISTAVFLPFHAHAQTDSETAQIETQSDLDETLGEVLAGHSFHGNAFNEGPRQSAYLMGGTGNVRFPVTTTNPEVQQFINQGVGQLHGFWYLEAERTFRHAASLDPDCAMAYWGAAMATESERERADGFIQEAVARIEGVTERERQYIKALETFLKTPEEREIKKTDEPDSSDANTKEPYEDEEEELTSEAKKKRAEKLLTDFESIAIEFPDDIEARAFIVHRIWFNRRAGIPIASHIATESLIEEILEVEPLHPAHHYMIHLWDHRHPENAVKAAARCGVSAPSIAHMWHMPGHIYSRLKRYEDAVYQQEASARVDHAHMMRDRVMPDQINNFAHNNEWLIRNLIFLGRARQARELAINMTGLPRHPKYNTLDETNGSYSYGRRRLIQVLREFQLFDETVRICRETNLLPAPSHPVKHVEYLRLGCVAAVMTGNDVLCEKLESELNVMLTEARDERELLTRKTAVIAATQDCSPDQPPRPCLPESLKIDVEDVNKIAMEVKADLRDAKKLVKVCEKAVLAIAGHRQFVAGEYALAHELLTDATGEDVSWIAEVQIMAGENEDGFKLLQKQVDARPSEVLPLARMAYFRHKAGETDLAATALKELRECSSGLDRELPIFSRLDEVAVAAGFEENWLKPFSLSNDIGFRPGLDSLGPAHWSPSQAPEWSLTDSNEASISGNDFNGRPYLVIFYLGHGCLHCAEQIQAFSGCVQDFKDSGVEIVAISSDDREGLTKSVDSFEGDLPYYAFASDETLDVFRKFRAFDDFEQQPLHGTFLVDADGNVVWQDISYEPFMDHEFLLNETRRLLYDPSEATGLPVEDGISQR